MIQFILFDQQMNPLSERLVFNKNDEATLLSSELKGYIENPAYYLQDNNVSATALDYLMLTHGWRRYNLSSNSVAGSEIILMTKDEGVRVTSTDVNGLFIFQDFDFPDSASYYLQALNRKGRSLTL